jgi:hypothetical protein
MAGWVRRNPSLFFVKNDEYREPLIGIIEVPGQKS